MTYAIESIIIGFEGAEKLKNSGFPQYDTLYSWERENGNVRPVESSDVTMTAISSRDYFAAPTAQEIIELLPNVIHIEGEPYALYIAKVSTHYNVYYYAGNEMLEERGFPIAGLMEQTLADALAEMYCLLAEKGLLPPRS